MEKNALEVTADGYRRPALLNTCREIRSETLKIWYYGSRFKISVYDFNSDTIFRFTSSVRAFGIRLSLVNCRCNYYHNPPSWTNLVCWLRRYHAKEIHLAVNPTSPHHTWLQGSLERCRGVDEDSQTMFGCPRSEVERGLGSRPPVEAPGQEYRTKVPFHEPVPGVQPAHDRGGVIERHQRIRGARLNTEWLNLHLEKALMKSCSSLAFPLTKVLTFPKTPTPFPPLFYSLDEFLGEVRQAEVEQELLSNAAYGLNLIVSYN
ncbi:uncharacterized protein MYCFIDRAFT_179346 [Pseudocercospora fijiensis CIRAD86]|uniref:Uncharacterized protein n=1 Tax=Pseudocercospora fijiensis (strain CIRAD86) TaxID=383855 RepID=M3A0E4_PSEFD|nr:uncharacterized protein MYCFIDRAFT_179346 [Pseudocercospora fijiensis CIRAD86]EME77876.1 hypothetical protein MYCFIDRAFT_179346 [Pseudocercospora fijiensis CIRAD86]